MTDLTDNPNKKTFKEMTDAEQVALLLAKRKGEIIQHFASLQYVDWCDWVDNNDEKFMENRIYRTKPKSKDTDTSVDDAALNKAIDASRALIAKMKDRTDDQWHESAGADTRRIYRPDERG